MSKYFIWNFIIFRTKKEGNYVKLDILYVILGIIIKSDIFIAFFARENSTLKNTCINGDAPHQIVLFCRLGVSTILFGGIGSTPNFSVTSVP